MEIGRTFYSEVILKKPHIRISSGLRFMLLGAGNIMNIMGRPLSLATHLPSFEDAMEDDFSAEIVKTVLKYARERNDDELTTQLSGVTSSPVALALLEKKYPGTAEFIFSFAEDVIYKRINVRHQAEMDDLKPRIYITWH